MKMLYGARMCRGDLLRGVQFLASCVTKWSLQCDRDLHKLVCYLYATKHYKQVMWVGDDLEVLDVKLYADSDFAGCQRTMKSTSGTVTMVTGPNTKAI